MSIDKFSDRHIGPRENDIKQMLSVVNASSIEQLINETIPAQIHLENDMNLAEERALSAERNNSSDQLYRAPNVGGI